MTQIKKFKGKQYYVNPDRPDCSEDVVGNNISITCEYQEIETEDGGIDYDLSRKHIFIDIDGIRVVPNTVKYSINGSKFKSINL